MLKKQAPFSFKHFSVFYGTLSILLFLYIIVRAYNIGFTHDESISYTMTMGDKGWTLTANNHWLSTLFSFFLAKVFRYTEIILRLPNVLAFGGYAFFGFRFLQINCQATFAKYLGACLLLLNPFLLEFFSLFRGYGLALGATMAVFFYFSKILQRYKTLTYLKIVCWSLFAIYANYAFLFIIFALHFCYFFYSWRLAAEELKKYWGVNIVFLGCLVPAFWNLKILAQTNQLYYGGHTSLLTDTFLPLIEKSFSCSLLGSCSYLFLCLLLSFLLIHILQVSKAKNTTFFASTFMVLVLLFPSLYWLLGIKFPINRTALYFIPLVALWGSLSVDNMLFFSKKLVGTLAKVGAIILLLASLLNFSKQANLTFHVASRGESEIKNMLLRLASEVKQNPASKITLCADWTFEPTLNYYQKTQKLTWLKPIKRKQAIENCHYFFLRKKSNLHQTMPSSELLQSFPFSQTNLYKAL